MLLKLDNRPLQAPPLGVNSTTSPLRWPDDGDGDGDGDGGRANRPEGFWVRFWSDFLPAPAAPELLRYAAARGFLEYW